MPLTVTSYTVRYHLTCRAIHGEHIMVDTTDLRIEIAPYGSAGGNVSLHDISDNFDSIRVLEYSGICIGLLDHRVPLEDC